MATRRSIVHTSGEQAALVNSVVGSQALNKQPLLIAESLEEEFLRAGWPAGQRVGGEPELAERFGVGRDVVREAVRLLEARNHARMRRGPSGGLQVVQPEMVDLVSRLGGYAHICELDYKHVVSTWHALLGAAVRLIAPRPAYAWTRLAQELGSAAHEGMHGVGMVLIEASSSPLLGVCGTLIASLLPDVARAPLAPEQMRMLLPVNNAESLQDWVGAAHKRLSAEATADLVTSMPAVVQSDCSKSQAMWLVHQIMTSTPRGTWARGHLIGNEFDLAERYGVDKSVVRQAIRLMEDVQTAMALPGRGRGLVTRLPSTAPLSRLLCSYLVAHAIEGHDGERVFAALQVECAGNAAARATLEDGAMLMSLAEDLERLPAPLPVSALQTFERLQQHVARSILLGLLIDGIKAFLTWQSPCEIQASPEVLRTYVYHTRLVTAAICSGDRRKAMAAEYAKLMALARVRNHRAG